MAFILMTKEQAFAASSKMKSSGTKLQDVVQSLAVTAVMYSNLHGDVTVATRIFQDLKMVKALRRNAFVAFCEHFGQLEFDKDGFVYHKKQAILDGSKTEGYVERMVTMLSLAENQWYQFAPEPVTKSVYDVQAEFDKFMKRIHKLANEKDVTLAHPELINKLAQFSTVKVDPVVDVSHLGKALM